jgi:hypothetical protein
LPHAHSTHPSAPGLPPDGAARGQWA